MDTIEHVFKVLRDAILAGEISPNETVKYLDKLQAIIPAGTIAVVPELDADIADRFEHVEFNVGPWKLQALARLREALAYAKAQGVLDDASDFVGSRVVSTFVERINDDRIGGELRQFGEDDGRFSLRELTQTES